MENDLIRRFSEKKRHGWYLCPRCGFDRMNQKAARNALSRRADIMVCDRCGTEEALEDANKKAVSMGSWLINEHPERFFMKGKEYWNYYFTFDSWEDIPFQNAYIIAEGFSASDAYERFLLAFPDANPGVNNYAFYYTETRWPTTVEAKKLPYAGILRLNGRFEAAE